MNIQAIIFSFVLSIGLVLLCISTRTIDEDSEFTKQTYKVLRIIGGIVTGLGAVGYVFTVYQALSRAHRKHHEKALRKLEQQVIRKRTETISRIGVGNTPISSRKETQENENYFRIRPLKIQNHRQSGTTERACQLCRKIFTSGEPSYSVNDSFWHINCFRCSQCLERISVDETFYELSKRLYCEHDYLTLYMPICTKCNKYVIGKVIRSMNMSFHENCFKCEFCDEVLSNNGAYRHEDKVICYDCSHRIQRKRIYYCEKCKHPIEEEEVLIIKSNPYHCYHFNCTHCKAPLTKSGRQRKDMPLCPRCYDRTCYTCFSCKLVIDPQTERSVVALDKHWHIDHFRCTMCRNVLHSKEFFEKKGLPYCKTHILEINGIVCFLCGLHPKGDFIDIFHKRFCQNCYRCRLCDRYLSHSDKVYENDMLPICRKCMKVKNVKQFILEKRH